MLPDRNKTELTHKVTTATYNWLDAHGFKPIETEVEMPTPGINTPGWIADLAAVIDPTQTELIEMKFIPRRPKWNTPQHDEWEKNCASLKRRMTCLVEVKTQRGDFTGDKKWKRTLPTDLAFVALVPNIVREDEWPEGWGILELRGEVMVKLRNPVPRVASIEEHLHVIYQIAQRRDHRTRYAAVREMQKKYRLEDAQHKHIARVDKVLRAVTDIVTGTFGTRPLTSVEQALEWHGLRDVQERHLERLRPLFGIAAKPKIPASPGPSSPETHSGPAPAGD